MLLPHVDFLWLEFLDMRNHITGLSLLALLLLGCTSGGDAAPKTTQASVAGTMTFDGKPIPLDSSVIFKSDLEGATAAGLVDSLGSFTLKAALPTVGLPIGRYKVIVLPPNPISPTAPVQTGNNDAYMKAMTSGPPKKSEKTKPKTDSILEIPDEFRVLDSTPLIIELKPGENKLNFDLAKLRTKK